MYDEKNVLPNDFFVTLPKNAKSAVRNAFFFERRPIIYAPYTTSSAVVADFAEKNVGLLASMKLLFFMTFSLD